MIPIKIQCDCGQRYAFEAEPVDGRLASPITCPTCGADGTRLANEFIASQLCPEAPITIPAAKTPLHATTATQVTHRPTASIGTMEAYRLGLVSREQAAHEARAKALWGDPPEEVTKYLMFQGYSADEATALVAELMRERKATVRSNGIRKTITGCGLVCVAVVGLPILIKVQIMTVGIMGLTIMALPVMAGLWGVYLLINGIIMTVAPKIEKSSVADQ